eukprot:7384383-Prymnesium_polylepis.3
MADISRKEGLVRQVNLGIGLDVQHTANFGVIILEERTIHRHFAAAAREDGGALGGAVAQERAIHELKLPTRNSDCASLMHRKYSVLEDSEPCVHHKCVIVRHRRLATQSATALRVVGIRTTEGCAVGNVQATAVHYQLASELQVGHE